MSVVTFWSNGKEETGKTLSVAAISTYMAIEHNYKILVIATGFHDKTLSNCFWKDRKSTKKNLGLFGPNANEAIGEGIEGLAKIAKSNKISPESITNYTKVIFKDHLEVLQGFQGSREKYEELRMNYADVINMANQYYDLVFVDLDGQIGDDIEKTILQNSNLIVATLNQRLTRIDNFMEAREKNPILNSMKTLLMIGRYDRYSKYSIKNLSRYMKEKNKVSTIPYNTLFFEACEEAKVPDLFLSLRKINEEERNGFFLAEVKRTSENIIYRLQDLQMRM
jgi:hypothetical protein